MYNLSTALIIGLSCWVVILIFRLGNAFTTEKIVNREVPNEGIHRSLHNASFSFFIGLCIGLSSGLITGLFVGLAAVLILTAMGGVGVDIQLGDVLLMWLRVALIIGLIVGLSVGLVLGLQNGGHAFLKHYILRFFLWRKGYAPWNYSRFLNLRLSVSFSSESVGGMSLGTSS